MKRIFRRNQIIITTLAVMIAAAGYLNYSAKREAAGTDVYEAGMMEISDEDILAENQASSLADDGSLTEIASLDGDGEELLPDGNVAAMSLPEARMRRLPEVTWPGRQGWRTQEQPGKQELKGHPVPIRRRPVWKIPEKRY